MPREPIEITGPALLEWPLEIQMEGPLDGTKLRFRMSRRVLFVPPGETYAVQPGQESHD